MYNIYVIKDYVDVCMCVFKSDMFGFIIILLCKCYFGYSKISKIITDTI